MVKKYCVSLLKIIDEFKLKQIVLPVDPEKILIKTPEINRPGLFLSGYFKHFQSLRIQIIGKLEFSYLKELPLKLKIERLFNLCEQNIPAIIVSSGLEISNELIEAAKKFNIPLLQTNMITSDFIAAVIKFLNVELGSRIKIHGVFVEVYGEGILILGESGIGKSEAAIELIKRGHRLIADDSVEIRKVSDRTLLGSSPEKIRHFMEIRGIGIVNVKELFGVGSVKEIDRISMVIKLEQWKENEFYGNFGFNEVFEEFLGIKIKKYVIPIKPGRNLAVLIETAAINNRQKKMGYDAAKNLFSRIKNEEE